MAAIDKIFERQRLRARQEANTAKQQAGEALQRRFASLGAANSGAQLKQERIATEDVENRLQRANESIDDLQLKEKQRVDEINQARAFSRSEREASQKFAAGQAEIQRKFTTGERLGSQDFAAAQAALQRKFASGERLSQNEFLAAEALKNRDFQAAENLLQRQFMTSERLGSQEFAANENLLNRGFQKEMFTEQATLTREQNRLAREQQEKQFNEIQRLAGEQFTWQKYIDGENLKLADKMANEKGMLETLTSQLGSGNFFGGINDFFGWDNEKGGGWTIYEGDGSPIKTKSDGLLNPQSLAPQNVVNTIKKKFKKPKWL